MYEQFEIKPRTQDVFAQQACCLGFFDGTAQVHGRGGVFATQEDVAAVGFQGASTDQHAFDQQMGQLLHQHAVFPGVGLHFIGVTQQVTDVHGFVFGHQPPLHTRGETCTATTFEAGVFHGLDDIVLSHVGECLAGRRVAVFGLIFVKPHRLAVVTQTPGQRMGFCRARNAVGRPERSQGHG